MTEVLLFIGGAMVGGCLGVFAMCLFIVNHEDRDDE